MLSKNLTKDHQRFLDALQTAAGPDLTGSASMYDVGALLGHDRQTAQRLGETLIAEGLIDIRTLAGAVGLTRTGLEATGRVDSDMTPQCGQEVIDIAARLGWGELELSRLTAAEPVLRPLSAEQTESLARLLEGLDGLANLSDPVVYLKGCLATAHVGPVREILLEIWHRLDSLDDCKPLVDETAWLLKEMWLG